jgi:hypothetical protein
MCFFSGLPLIGNIFLIFAALFLPKNAFLGYTAIGILLFDTGGLPWILVMLLWNWIFAWRKKTS